MKTIEELINTEDPAWPIVTDWIAQAGNKAEILPCDKQRAKETLYHTQVTTRSMMGAIIYETGGILIDNGWLRLLGSGSPTFQRTLATWNKGRTFAEYGEPAPYLFVADDVLGGLFAINGGYLGEDAGNIYYFDPQSLDWFPLEMGYADFLMFCFHANLDEFYEGLRWDNWQNDVQKLRADDAYTFFPYLWTEEGRDIENSTRKVLPIGEVYELNLDMKISFDQEHK